MPPINPLAAPHNARKGSPTNIPKMEPLTAPTTPANIRIHVPLRPPQWAASFIAAQFFPSGLRAESGSVSPNRAPLFTDLAASGRSSVHAVMSLFTMRECILRREITGKLRYPGNRSLNRFAANPLVASRGANGCLKAGWQYLLMGRASTIRHARWASTLTSDDYYPGATSKAVFYAPTTTRRYLKSANTKIRARSSIGWTTTASQLRRNR
jgi:hypothetical protein